MIGKTNSVIVSGGENTLKKVLDATKSCYYLFMGYKGTSVDDLIQPSDTENVTEMSYMFHNCSNLISIPNLNTNNVKGVSFIFYGCRNLTSIPNLNTSNVTSTSYMFGGCSRLVTIPLLNTSKVTAMDGMFYNCNNLTTVPALDASNVTSMNNMFDSNYNLKSILMTNIGADLDIHYSTKFERTDLVTILNNLKTVTETKTLTMGADNLAKLTDEDKAIAINKG